MLTIGTKLGPYEIVGAIGAGGMGEVYRARDTRLARTVAIKILLQHLSSNPEFRQRFGREARAISSLQHPNLCTLYDVGQQDGVDFLVMEYLEGETLADRLTKGPLATDQILKLGLQICEGLHAAHRAGVVHRDLKPGNIMLTKTGVKLLDFGLAKPLETSRALSLTALPTASKALPNEPPNPLTAQGTVVGTFQYMSPEQLEGKEADARSDIFSLGAVLHEMATGKRAFEGKTTASVIAAVLEREPPPISQVQQMSPPALDRVVNLCLTKDPDGRFQSAHDVKLQLEWIRDAGSQAGVPAPVVARRKLHERFWIAATAVATMIAAAFGVGYFLRAPQPAPAIVSEISAPPNTSFVLTGNFPSSPVFSPDGTRLAFAARDANGKQRLWVQRLDAVTAQPLRGTDGATFPFWSPDGRSIGFFANGTLNRIDASGGPVLTLAAAPVGRGGAWSRAGLILFTPSSSDRIYCVSANGGTPQAVTKLNIARQETTHRWPQFLTDGRHFLFYAHGNDLQNSGTYAASLDGGEPKLIVRGGSNAVYAPPGYLLFVRQGILMAQRFDAPSLQIIGEPTPLAENAGSDETVWQGLFAVSDTGLLAYGLGNGVAGVARILWYDRSGKQVAQTGSPGDFATPAISPGGAKLAVTSFDYAGGKNDIWVYDLARPIKTRLTFSSGVNAAPVWSPDGKQIIFVSSRAGPFQLYRKSSDGMGSTTRLLVDDAQESHPALSMDGHYLFFRRQSTQPGSRFEIWAMLLFGDRKAFPVVQDGRFDVGTPALSPDGKWLAYNSSESGQTEIYVIPFLHGGGKLQVSTQGGIWPRWRGNGKELFYLGVDNRIMSAQISEQGASLAIGKVEMLFQANPTPGHVDWTYDVSPDGKKFVVATAATQQGSAPLTLVTNWPALLKRQ